MVRSLACWLRAGCLLLMFDTVIQFQGMRKRARKKIPGSGPGISACSAVDASM
jgi:hypothetical protein